MDSPPPFSRVRRTDVLSPLKLKSRPSILGAENPKASGSPLGEAVDMRTARVREANHLGDLVERLTRRIVQRRPDLQLPWTAHVHQLG